MTNQNTPVARLKKSLRARWESEDYPGAKPRFQLQLFAKDFAIFIMLPFLSVILFKSCEVAITGSKRTTPSRVFSTDSTRGGSRSQIIVFSGGTSSGANGNVVRRAPGALIKVRLLNVIETYSNAPVHAQIVDAGLGKEFVGSTIVGDASSDTNFDRIEINFRFVRNPKKPSVAYPITARALSLDGTLGIAALKKEGFFARAALNSSNNASQDLQGKFEGTDLKQLIAKALTAGLVQEFGSASQVERNRSQVLTVQPSTEFFVELTDYFPGTK